MAEATRPAVGLSVGATNLAAVTAERAVTRKPVLTLYQQRPPEVGVPSENPRLTERGLVITDFVDRVGDPTGIVAADGSTHRSETLLADALRVLAYAATEGRALPQAVAVSHPAHWSGAAVDALRAALRRVTEWSHGQVWLLADSEAALTALRANPGVPTRGFIALCDLGGSGTSITVVDAADDCQPVGPTVRHTDFSGDVIDQALLNHVLGDLSAAGSFDASGTSAIGSLNRLRADCRIAKEQLSSSAATTLTADLPGFRGDIRLTRSELDDAIRAPLDSVIVAVQETLERNGISAHDLVAVASAGGGANIPLVTTTLSERLGVPVITAPRPHLTAAVGAALRAAYGGAAGGDTALAPTAASPGASADPTAISEAPLESSPLPALAWSEADDDSGIMPIQPGEYPTSGEVAGSSFAPPQPPSDQDSRPGGARPAPTAWYRRPVVVILGTALVALAIGAAIIIALRHLSPGAPGAPGAPAPGVSTPPASSEPAGQSPAPQSTTGRQPTTTSAPSTGPTTSQPPSTTTTTTTSPPLTTTTTAPSSSTQTTTTQQSSTQSSTSTSTARIPRIPRLPSIP